MRLMRMVRSKAMVWCNAYVGSLSGEIDGYGLFSQTHIRDDRCAAEPRRFYKIMTVGGVDNNTLS